MLPVSKVAVYKRDGSMSMVSSGHVGKEGSRCLNDTRELAVRDIPDDNPVVSI